MAELIFGLFAFVFVLACIALVGHFIWIATSWVVGEMFGRRPAPPARRSSFSPLEDDLSVTERQLRRLYHSNAMTQQQWDEMSDVIRRERTRQQLARVSAWTPVIAGEPIAERSEKPAPQPVSEALDIVAFVDEPQPPSQPAADVYGLSKPSSAVPETRPVTAPPEYAQPTPVAALTAPAAPMSAGEPPRGTLADLLQAFMEERNIRWGELMSGMLIVGSAVGLVISLWATLQESIPYFPALLFMLVTSAIHGAGLYTLRRWKLKSTSRGLLVIAALLVPLNFLAAIVLAEQSPESEQARRAATDPLYLTAVVVGLLAYGAISYSSGRVLLRSKWWPLFLALMGPSAAQLYIVRWAKPDMPLLQLNLLSALPFAAFLAAVGTQLKTAAGGRRLSGRRLAHTQLLLGVALFSVVMPIALIVWKTQPIEIVWKAQALERTLAALSPGLTLVAAMILSTGLLIHRRVTQPELATTRTVGTALAMVGSGLMVATVVLAWPRPELLIAVGLLAFAVLTVLAILADLPILNVPAVVSFSLALVVGMHLWMGTISPGDGGTTGLTLARVLLMGRSGIALAFLSIVAAAASKLPSLPGRGRGTSASSVESRVETFVDGTPLHDSAQPTRAASYLYSAVALAAVSLMIALRAGFFPRGEDGDWVTPIFAMYAAAVLAFGYRARSAAAVWASSGLLLLMSVHALVRNNAIAEFLTEYGRSIYLPGVVAALAHASIATLIALATAFRKQRQIEHDADRAQRRVIEPLVLSALLTSGLVLPFVWFFNNQLFTTHAVYAFWATAIWLSSAFLLRSPLLFFAGQGLASVATGLAVTAVCMRQPWWNGNDFEPWHIQAQLAVLASLALMFVVARILTSRLAAARHVMSSWPLSFDRLLLAAVVVGIVALAGLACGPGLARELTPVGARPSLVEADTFALMALAAIGCAALFAAAFAAFRGKGLISEVAAAQAAGVLTVLAFIILAAIWNPDRAVALWFRLNVSHVDAYGMGTWVALAMAAIALTVSLWERMRPAALLLLVLAGAAVPILIAAAAEANLDSATILRFGLAVYGLAIAGLLAYRTQLRALANRVGVNRPEPLPAVVIDGVRQLSLALTLLPVWVLMARAIVLTAGGRALAGPAFPSALASWGEAAVYGGPMLVLAAALIVHAIRERRAAFALAASLTVQAGLTAAQIVNHWSNGQHLDGPALVEILQANALGLAIASLVWLAIRHRIEPQPSDQPSTAFNTQLGLAVVTISALVSWAAIGIIYSPAPLPLEVAPIGRWPSYAALLMTAIACLWSRTKGRQAAVEQGIIPYGIGLTTLEAASLTQLQTSDAWLAFHVLTGGWCALLGGTTLAYYVQRRQLVTAQADESHPNVAASAATQPLRGGLWSSALVRWATGLGIVLLALAVRGELSDPLRPHWSAGMAAWVALSAVAFGLIRRSQRAAYVSTAIAMLAAALFWLPADNRVPGQDDIVFLEAILIAAASMGFFWLIVELYWQRRWNSAFDLHAAWPGVHRSAGVATLGFGWALFALCMMSKTFGLRANFANYPVISDAAGGLLVASIGLLLLGTLWDRMARHSLAAVYVFGLMPAAIAIDTLNLFPADLVFAIGCVLCAYVLLTSTLWWQRERLAAIAQSSGIPAMAVDPARIGEWLQPVNLWMTAVALSITTWSVLTFSSQTQRLVAAAASLLLVPAMILLGAGRRTSLMRFISLLTAAAVGVEFGWALLPVDNSPEGWLHRSIRLLVVLAGTAFLYTASASRVVREASAWYEAVRRAAAAVAGASLIALSLVLLQQGSLYQPGVGAPVDNPEIIAVAVVLVGLAAALVSMAMLPGADPLELTDRGRMLYVYAAEAVAALLILHLRLTTPELFEGYLRPYWPLIVIAIAFFGIGAGELFRRKNWSVLAEPLERTGAFLPLLPALGFWAVSSEMSYSADLFMIGLMYIVASMWRKSFVYGLAAALAGNGALWAMLHEQGWKLLAHPQMWFIPPALSVLTAAQMNRRNLTEAQLTSLRYLCVTVIYVSSTGEMFITGVADSLWLPMILAALSVAGVFAGIVMRVRAFLYLGSSFLMLSIVSMVWHAAQKLDHVWPWWAFGIVLGLSILALFGLFEKKRNDALLLLDRVRQWEP